jgi:acyl-CoA thioesterase FadM
LLALVDDLLLPSMAFGMVRKASYTYDKELHPQEPVTIYTWIHSVGNSSANCYQEAWQNNQCAVLAETVLLAIDASTHQASPLTKDAKILLLSHSKNRRDPINQPKQTRKQEVKSL